MSLVVERARSVTLATLVLELLPVVLAVGLLAAVGIMHVTGRSLVVAMGYELSRLDAQTAELTRENAGLKLELATLQAPARLEKLAREKLKLRPPQPSQLVSAPRSEQP
jgi:cell division protein FtsL